MIVYNILGYINLKGYIRDIFNQLPVLLSMKRFQLPLLGALFQIATKLQMALPTQNRVSHGYKRNILDNVDKYHSYSINIASCMVRIMRKRKIWIALHKASPIWTVCISIIRIKAIGCGNKYHNHIITVDIFRPKRTRFYITEMTFLTFKTTAN